MADGIEVVGGIERIVGSCLNNLEECFRSVEEKMAKFPAVAEESEAKTAYQNMTDGFLKSIYAEIKGSQESIARQLKAAQENISEAYAHYSRLIYLQINREMEHGGRNITYYWAIYLALVIGAIVVFAWNFSIIMPEQHLWMAIVQSIVMAGPSFLINQAFMRCRSRDTFLRRLHIIGISASVTMVLAAGIARATAYYLMNNAGGSIMAATGSWMDKLHLILSGLTFIACLATDITFSGRLMIIISQHTEMKHISESIAVNIVTWRQKIDEMEAEAVLLSQKLEWEDIFDDVAKPWREAKIQEQLMAHKERYNKVRDDAISKLRSLPTIELVKRAS